MSGYGFALEYNQRLRENALVRLREYWGDAYLISWENGEYTGKRRDGKGIVTDKDAETFWRKLREDLTERPVMAEVRVESDPRRMHILAIDLPRSGSPG